MHALVAIVGSFDNYDYLPVIGWLGMDMLVFFDYRMPHAQRIQKTIDLCRKYDIDKVIRVASGVPGTCTGDIHDWDIPQADRINHVTCRVCGEVTTFPQVNRLDAALRVMAS